ncbi:DNA primase [Candidatus Liberibacter americanus]|nr:DNA primase [Candidatus Liberibacter americanus]
MYYNNDFIKELLVQIPLSNLIGQYVNWDSKKTNYAKGDYWACCPFHDEKTPSFHCYDQKGFYYCFSCQAKGDHFSFLSALLGCSFVESVQKLANISGIALPTNNPNLVKKEKERSGLLDIIEAATQFYQESLKKHIYGRLRNYLDERGINNSSIEKFRLGYAPYSRNALIEHLRQKSFSQEKIAEVGLLSQGDSGAYDRFRDRLIFPILSSRGKVIAFGGRSISAKENTKYLNSPETTFFYKGKNLYNFFGAFNHNQQFIVRDTSKGSDSSVILVEGYIDVISLYQAGIQNVVSSLGTALTEHQLNLLWKLSHRVFLCFDGDDPGLRAAYKAIDLLLFNLTPGKRVNFILLPDGDDPDSFIRRCGKDAFDQLIVESLPLIDLIWKRETDNYSFKTPDDRAELEIRLKNVISSIKDKQLQYYYSKDIKDRLNQLFRRPINHYRSWNNNSKNKYKNSPSKRLIQSFLVKGKLSQKPSLREATLLMTIINHPQLLKDQYDDLTDISYENIELQKIWSFLFSEFIIQKDLSYESIYQKLCDRGFGSLLKNLDKQVRDAGLWSVTVAANIVDVREGYKQALDLYKRFRLLSRQKDDLENQIAKVTEEGDENKATILISILHDIHVEIDKIEHQDAIIEGFGKMSGRNNS